ncbi:C45 family peptidase [Saprospiraceae bacterium]|nr:C45 family peptidase [Saprospiraceae bacterium]
MKIVNPAILLTILYSLMTIPQDAFACTLFCASMNGEVLAAGNEDWSDPFSKMWVSERTVDRYGIINLGHSDFQVQTAINEYGLYFDFAAIPKAEGRNQAGKEKCSSSLFSEILAKCKNLEEAILYLKKYQYESSYNQVLMADALGNSLIVNRDTIFQSQKAYQIATNFNSCDLVTSNYDCRRYEILDESLISADQISIPLFRKLLSNTHQEGDYPTQYSYIFDLKKGVIYLYSFHNYENVIVLNVKEELDKGYSMKNFKELFPQSYEEEYFRNNHRELLTHQLIDKIRKDGADVGLKIYKDAVHDDPEVASYPFVLLSTAGGLVHHTWFEDQGGMVFDYWFNPHNVLQWKSVNKDKVRDILKIYDYLESTIPKENPKQFIGTYELKGLLYYLLDEKEKSKDYFQKTIDVAPPETSNYQRAKFFLEEYFEK